MIKSIDEYHRHSSQNVQVKVAMSKPYCKKAMLQEKPITDVDERSRASTPFGHWLTSNQVDRRPDDQRGQSDRHLGGPMPSNELFVWWTLYN